MIGVSFVTGTYFATEFSRILTIAVVVMLLALSTYCLPSLLGYLLFVGISGRFDPISRPTHLQERPSWALGIWVGTTTGLVLTTCLFLAYRTTYSRIGTLLEPGLWLLAALLLPGLIAAITYRNTVNRILTEKARVYREQSMALADVIDFPLASARSIGSDNDLPEIDDTSPMTAADSAADSPMITSFLESAEPGRIVVPDIPVARHDDSLRIALNEERSLREETEKHLRITRRALHRLEAESREGMGASTDAMIALERELGTRMRETAAAEESAVHDATWRADTEQQLFDLKDEILTSRSDARRSNAAREKALAAAGRSVALARQAVESREALEARLFETEQLLENRQETITSLITALETEKSRTHEDVAALAKQWVLQERQLHTRRSLEEVARSVEGRLTTRMARKVARARPIVSSN